MAMWLDGRAAAAVTMQSDGQWTYPLPTE